MCHHFIPNLFTTLQLLQCPQLKGKVQKILTWRWQETPVEDEEEKKEREERRKKEEEEYESMDDDEKKKLDAWRAKQKELEEGR